MLARTPVFTLVIMFTLAVGVGANTAMFSVVNAVLLQGLPFRDADRIVDINEVEVRDRERGAIAPANFLDWRAQAKSFDTMSVYSVRNINLSTTGGEPERLVGAFTSTTFFDVLGVPPVLGRTFLPSEAEPGQAVRRCSVTDCGSAALRERPTPSASSCGSMARPTRSSA